jgi:predicted RecA/RadA family phage recombinase
MAEATTYQSGNSTDFTAAAATDRGDVVVLGNLVGVAADDLTSGAAGVAFLEDNFGLAKSGSAGPIFGIGDPVHFDITTRLAVKPKLDSVYMGLAAAAAGTSDTVVYVRRENTLPSAMVDRVWEDVTLAGGSKTLDLQDTGKVLNVTVGHATNVITLPAVAVGYDLVIRCGTTGQRVAISPNANDLILGADNSGVNDKDLLLLAAVANAGDYVHLTYGNADGWLLVAARGNWTREG